MMVNDGEIGVWLTLTRGCFAVVRTCCGAARSQAPVRVFVTLRRIIPGTVVRVTATRSQENDVREYGFPLFNYERSRVG